MQSRVSESHFVTYEGPKHSGDCPAFLPGAWGKVPGSEL